jgi:hypothetical protein
MGKIRSEVAVEVRDAFRTAEAAAEQSAATIARCMAVIIEARGKAKLPPVAAAEAIELIAKGAQSSFKARQHMLAAHPLLAELGRELNVLSFGPDGGCVPNSPFTEAASPLRVVSG